MNRLGNFVRMNATEIAFRRRVWDFADANREAIEKDLGPLKKIDFGVRVVAFLGEKGNRVFRNETLMKNHLKWEEYIANEKSNA